MTQMWFEMLKQVQKKSKGAHSRYRTSELNHNIVELQSVLEEIENIEKEHRLGYLPHEAFLIRLSQLTYRKNVLILKVRDKEAPELPAKLNGAARASKIERFVNRIACNREAMKEALKAGIEVLRASIGLLKG